MVRKPQEVLQSLEAILKPGFVGSTSKKSEQRLLRDAKHIIEKTASALAIIQTWCEFEGGIHANRNQIIELCRRTMEGER